MSDPSASSAALPPRTLAAVEHFLRVLDWGERNTVAMRRVVDEPAIVTNLPMLVLTTLRQHGRMRPTEIEAATRLRSGHLSALLERLESMGMLTRAQGEVPGDRRAVLVELTPKGRRNAVAIAQSLVDSTQSLLRELDPELERIRSGRSTPGAGTAGR